MIYCLISLCLAMTDPNAMSDLRGLAANWCQAGQPIKAEFLFEGTEFTWQERRGGTLFNIHAKSEGWMKLTGIEYRPVGMPEFNRLARVWPGDPNYPSGYYVCPRNKDKLYHVPYPNCPATKGYKMQSIPAMQLSLYKPCPVCLPEPVEPNLAEMLDGVTNPELIEAIKELL